MTTIIVLAEYPFPGKAFKLNTVNQRQSLPYKCVDK